MQAIDLEKLIEIIHFFPNSVHILATDGFSGKRAITVSSVVPFSYTPPSMLVCVQKNKKYNQLFLKNKVFTINTLAKQQQDLALLFGGQTDKEHEARFEFLENKKLTTGAPILKQAALVFDCVLDTYYEHFTHYILIGKIVDTYLASDIDDLSLLMCRKKQYLTI